MCDLEEDFLRIEDAELYDKYQVRKHGKLVYFEPVPAPEEMAEYLELDVVCG